MVGSIAIQCLPLILVLQTQTGDFDVESKRKWDAGRVFWLLFSLAGGVTIIAIGARTGETLTGVFLSIFFWIPAFQIMATKGDPE